MVKTVLKTFRGSDSRRLVTEMWLRLVTLLARAWARRRWAAA